MFIAKGQHTAYMTNLFCFYSNEITAYNVIYGMALNLSATSNILIFGNFRFQKLKKLVKVSAKM